MTTDVDRIAGQHEILPAGYEEGDNGIQLFLDLEATGAVTATGLRLTDPTLPFERWVALGRMLGRVNRASKWAIADWINFGEGVYPDKYAQAVEVTGLSRDSLMNISYVGRQVVHSRRVAELPFSFHEAVAPLEPDAQRDWLKRALEEGWTRDRFRDEIRPVKAAIREGREQPALGEAKKRADEILLEAAQAVIGSARRAGPDVIVSAESFARLKSAVEGE